MKFRFVDKILGVEANRWIEGLKTVSLEEFFALRPFGVGHLFPPMLMSEALFQLGNFLIFKSFGDKLALQLMFRRITIYRHLGPGDVMQMRVELTRVIDDTVRLDGTGRINGQTAIKGEGCLAKLVEIERLYDPEKFARYYDSLCG